MSRPNVRNAMTAAAFAVVAWPTAAHATTLAELSVAQMTDASTYIVRGHVTAVWVDQDTSGLIWSHAKLSVEKVLKGPDAPKELVVDQMGGTLNGETDLVYSAAQFSVDEEVFIFLDAILDGSHYTPVAMFEGKYTVRRAPNDTREDVTRWQGNPHDHYDARFLPHPDHILLYEDLVADVKARLATGWDGQKIPGISPAKLEQVNTADRRLRP